MWIYVLFEEYVGRVCQDVFEPKGLDVDLQGGGERKRLDPRSADLGVSGGDVYQVLAYAHRYVTDTAVLIYPHHAALGRPGLQRDFVIQAGGGSRVVVRVAMLGLARLERVAAEVGEAVGAGIGAGYWKLARGRRLGAEADAVTALLEKALAEISMLPPPQQEEVAAWLLAELTDVGHWASSFARSQPTLDTLADEALAEHSAGLTETLDPERL